MTEQQTLENKKRTIGGLDARLLDRVEIESELDKRTITKEVEVLLEEALDARKERSKCNDNRRNNTSQGD